MKRLNKLVIVSAVAVAMLCTVAPFAQAGGAQTPKRLRKPIDRKNRTIRPSRIPFRRFSLQDLNQLPGIQAAGRIGPNSHIRVNGRPMRAEDVLKTVNKVEAWLNERGETFRDGKPKRFHRSLFDAKKVNAQFRRIRNDLQPMNRANLGGFEPLSTEKIRAFRSRAKQGPFPLAPTLKQPVTKKPAKAGKRKTKVITKNWSRCITAADLVGLCLNTHLRIEGHNGQAPFIKLQTGGSVRGNIDKHDFTLAKARGFLVAGEEIYQLRINAEVLGKSVYNVDQIRTTGFSHADEVAKTVDESYKTTIVVLGVPINVEIGFRGRAGFRYATNLSNLNAEGAVEPFAQTQLYGQLSVGASGFVEAGIRGTATLFDGKFSLYGKVWLAPGREGVLSLNYAHFGLLNLTILKGKLELFGSVGRKPFKVEETVDIVKFPGLVNYSKLIRPLTGNGSYPLL